ncbi:hypothetical protein GCM10009602_17760 [Nocardiopsis tropica]
MGPAPPVPRISTGCGHRGCRRPVSGNKGSRIPTADKDTAPHPPVAGTAENDPRRHQVSEQPPEDGTDAPSGAEPDGGINDPMADPEGGIGDPV